MAVPRVEIKTQSWGVVQDAAGNAQSGLTATIARLDAVAATVYQAATGGTTTTPSTNSSGEIAGWIEPAEYTLTLPGRSAVRVQANRALPHAQGGTTGAPEETTVWQFQPRDTAKGPYTWHFHGATFNGTWDTVMYFGYNASGAGGRVNTSEPSFRWAIEQDYEVVEGEHWLESYWEYVHSNGLTSGRPIFVRINRDDGLMEGFDIRSSGVAFTDWGNDAQFAAIGGKTGAYYALGHASQTGPTVLDLTAQNSQEVALGLHSFRGDFTIYNPATDQWAFAVDSGLEAFMQVSEGTGNPIGFGNADVGQNATVTIQSKDGVKTVYPTLKLKTISGQDQNLLSLQDSSNVELAAFTVTGSMLMVEQTEPAAPAADKVLVYAKDNGSGKTQLMARFSSGAAQQIAIQP